MSVVAVVAGALRRDAMAREDGTFLGTEEMLSARYGVSRPTLRQALAQVCQEQLLTVKRGVNGGYFVSRPSAQTVAHLAALYLRSEGTDLPEVLEAAAHIRAVLAELAAKRGKEPQLADLARFLEAEAEAGPDQGINEFRKAERQFLRLLGAMSGNGVLRMFMNIAHQFSRIIDAEDDKALRNLESTGMYRVRRNALAEAILAQDEDVTAIAARRCMQVTDEVSQPRSRDSRWDKIMDSLAHHDARHGPADD
jgi:GntR family transcriptional regulator, transcriptional repressor for pyruvate dehydrogenase complex